MDENQYIPEHVKGAVEALLFVSDKPVSVEQIRESLQTVEAEAIAQAIRSLQEEYSQRNGLSIEEIAGGYQIVTRPAHAATIRNFFKTRHKEKLSKPSLETLAIIAYKQPVTRADIEAIRGVNSDGVVTHLMDKELIKIVGRKDIPGKPYMYGSTRYFLEYFGLKSLKSLPKLEEFPDLQAPDIDQEMDVDPALALEEGGADPDLLSESSKPLSANATSAPTTVSEMAERVIRESSKE